MMSTIGGRDVIVRSPWSLALALFLLVAVFPHPTNQMTSSSGVLLLQTVCPSSNHSPPVSSDIIRDRAGLTAMLDLAASARIGLQPQTLPYSQLVAAFSQLDANATNLHTAFQSAIASAGVSLATKAMFSASLALTLGFSLPCVFFLLWWILPKMWRLEEADGWEGEGVDDDFYRDQLDRTRSEQEKNMSFKSQLCGWFMASVVVMVMVVLVVFVGVLLAGNQWVSEGMASSSTAAQQVLPKLSELRTDAIQEINTTLWAQYESFKMSFQQKSQSLVADLQVDMADKEDEGRSLVLEVQMISDGMKLTKTYLEHIIGNWSKIKAFEEGTVDALHRAVSAASVQCGLVLQSNTSASSSPLHGQCRELEEYLPTVDVEGAGEVVQLLEMRFLPVVKQIVSDSYSKVWYTVYEEEVEQSMRQYLEEHFTERTVAMEPGLGAVVAEVSEAYGTVDLHLPQSAEVVTEYMGERYLSSWEEMRFGSFLILCLFLLALVLVTLVFTGRGLLYIFAMYRSGYDAGTASTSMHSATVMQKSMWAAMAVLACLGVAIFVTLPASSSLGAVCGPHGNFSGATDYLLDRPEVWSGGYPLGSLLLGNSSATLTLNSLLSTCIEGGSLYKAFQLQGYYPFHQIELLQQEIVALVDTIGLFEPPLPSVLSPNVSAGLSASLNLPRETQLSLLQDLNNTVFANFSLYIHLLTNLTDNMLLNLGSLGTLRDSVSKVHALAVQTHQEYAAMAIQLKLMQREAFQVDQDIRSWDSHGMYVDEESQLSGEVQVLYATAYREGVGAGLVGVVQGEMGGVLQSVWTNVMCTAGECREAASLYMKFVGGVCADVLDGLDLIWSSSCAVFLTLIPLAVCTLLLSRRLSYPRSAQEDYSFNSTGTALGQAGSILWFVIAWTVDAWLLNTLKNSSDFHSQLCPSTSSGCCAQCVWIFALLFLSVSVVVALPCYLYQGYLIHRTIKSRIARTRNYWLRRYKAVHFYCRLWTLVVLDVPFLIFACVLMGSVQRLQLSAVLALTLPLLGAMAFVFTCVCERKDVRTYWLWLRKEVELKSDWVRRLAATPAPPPPPPPHRNGPVPSRVNMDEYEMSSIGSVHEIGPPLELGTSIPVLPPYTGHPFHAGLTRAERPSLTAAASDSETETYISGATGQSHYSRPRRHPSSVAIMDELVDPNSSEMQQRQQDGHYNNGGVEVVEPELYDSSTLHSGSLPSIFDSSSAYGPSSQHPYTSADEMYASDTFSQDDGGTRSRMRRRHSFSGDMFVDI